MVKYPTLYCSVPMLWYKIVSTAAHSKVISLVYARYTWLSYKLAYSLVIVLELVS